jgi:rhodanese-related sulfurtransferase
MVPRGFADCKYRFRLISSRRAESEELFSTLLNATLGMKGETMKRSCKGIIVPLLLSLLVSPGVNAQTQYQTIDTDRLHSMVVDNAYKLEGGKQTQYTVIDTRTPERYHQGHIFSAVNIPVRDLQLPSPMLPTDLAHSIVLYGDNTDLRSSVALFASLTQAGFTNIRIYSEPFSTWKNSHLPVVEPIAQRP